MKKSFRITAKTSLFVLLLGGIPAANATDMGIVTGGASGTYIKIGRDISSLVSARGGINLQVHTSEGSRRNVSDVYDRPGVQLGIVQHDVLEWIKSSGDSQLSRVANKIKMVFPLYNEEIHVLAANSIVSLYDLDGKRVAVGKAGSGTIITSDVVFGITGIRPAQQFPIGGQEAVSALLSGQIDAMFYVAGYPVKLFNDLDAEKVHLLSITDKGLSEFYVPSTIPAGTYPWQTGSISTLAAKAVLMSYDYKKANCGNVGRLARIIYDNQNWLRQNGHSKWNEVNLDQPVPKWEQYSCVTAALRGGGGGGAGGGYNTPQGCTQVQRALGICE